MKRRTKREREQRDAEASVVRKLGLSALVNPRVVMPDPEGVEALRTYGRELAEADRAGSVPRPAEERPRCERHGWQGSGPVWWAPRRRASDCPECLREHDHRAQPGQEVLVTNGGSLVPTKQATPRQEEAWKAHLAKLEARGEPLPGSDKERRILRQIESGRQRTRPADRVVWCNQYTGETIRRPWRKQPVWRYGL